MSSKERIGIILDVDAEVSKAKVNIGSLSKIFDGIGGSKGNQLRDLLSDISAEYEKLANESGKTMKKVGDFTKAEKSSERLSQLLRRLDKEVGNIGKSSKSDLSKFFPAEVADRVNKASNAVKVYNTILGESSKKKGAIGTVTDEYKKQQKAVKEAAEALKDLQDIQNGNSKKQAVTSDVKVKKQGQLAETSLDIKKYQKELQAAEKAMSEFKVRRAEIFDGTKNPNRYPEFRTLRDNLATVQANFKGATEKAAELKRELNNMVVVGELKVQIEDAEVALKSAQNAAATLKEKLDTVSASEFSRALNEAKKELEGLTDIDLSKITNIDDLTSLFERFKSEGVEGVKKALAEAGIEMKNLGTANEDARSSIQGATADVEAQNRAMEDVNGIKNRILQFFSLTNAMQLGRQAIRETIETVKELDAAMTETAVVTNFSVGDMWDQLPEYTDMAREYGVAIKGVYDASTLYYQQGLNQEQTMQLTGETLKMARIAGLEYADATDLMTAALRGFNMELNETNATRINDVYSELAAITAADTEEIATAMTKTASIAASANMEFETTAALLSQIIETTREPAETAGTAMKTIIARFTEMKEATSDIVNVDGEEVSVNKVESALKSAGVALRDANGEFRDLDDVFLELSSKWDSLDIMTQRYIATMAAGSRQQSRFIAMMQNYERTMELVDAAYNSSGASATQFGKTQESLETKIANLETAWQEFLMGISNSDAIKGMIDIITNLLNVLNDATTGVGGFSTFILRMFAVISTLKIGKSMFSKLFSGIGTQMSSGGTEAGLKLGEGIRKGSQASLNKTETSLKQYVKKMFKGTAISFRKSIKEMISSSTDGVSAQDFAKKLESKMDIGQIQGKVGKIGPILESALNKALNSNDLNQEGQLWAKTLIDGIMQQVAQGKITLLQAVEQLENEVAQKLGSADDEARSMYNSDEGYEQARKNVQTPQTKQTDEEGKTVTTPAKMQMEIPDETLQKAMKMEQSIEAWGAGITAASMAMNAVTAALNEAGVLSEDTKDGFDAVSTTLTTVGSLMISMKAAQKAFNIEANLNPYIAIAAVIIGTLSLIGTLIAQNAEREKEANEAKITAAKEYQEEVDAARETIDAYDEMVKTYEETGDGAEELQKRKEELIETLDLEKYGVDALTSSYEEVSEAAKQARADMLETNMIKQTAGLQGAMSQAETEGQKTGSSAGWNSNGFRVDIGAGDSYNELVSIFKEIAAEKGIEGLSYSEDFWGDLQISGLDNSPEGRRLFMELISEVLSKYGDALTKKGKDSGNSTAYNELSKFWGNVSEFFIEGTDTEQNIKNTEMEQAEATAKEVIAKEKNISTMSDFNQVVKKIINSLSDYSNLTEDEKKNVAISALGEESEQLLMYSRAYTQILRGAIDETSDAFLNLVNDLNEAEIRLIANGGVTIESTDSAEIIKQKAIDASFYDAIWGQASRSRNLSNYGDKLVSGEEISDEDRQNMSTYIMQEYDAGSYREWMNAQDEGVSVQLSVLTKLAGEKQKHIQEAITAYYDNFDKQIAENMAYGELYPEAMEGLSFYQDAKAYVTEKNKNNGKIAITNDELKLYTTYRPDYQHGEGNLEDHIKSYNYWVDESNNNYGVYSKETIENAEEAVKNWKEAQEHYDAVKALDGVHLIALSRAQTDLDNAKKAVTEAFGGDYKGASNVYGVGSNQVVITEYNIPSEEVLNQRIQDMKDENAVYKTEATSKRNQAYGNIIGELDYAFADDKFWTERYENSIERVFYDVGIDSAMLRTDLNDDGVADHLDVKFLMGKVDRSVDYARAATTIVNNSSAYDQLYDQQNQRFYTTAEAEAHGAFDIINFETANEALEILNSLKLLEEAEQEGYNIRVETDANGVKRAYVKVKDLKDEAGEGIELPFEVDDKALNEIEDRIEDINENQIKLEVQIDQAELEALETKYNSLLNEADNFNNALDMVNDSYQVAPENVREFARLMPELTHGVQVLDDGTWQLNQNLVDAAASAKAEELQTTSEEYINSIESQNAELADQANAYQKVRAAAQGSGEEVTGQEQEKAKSFIETSLAKEKQCAAETIATERNTNNSIEAAKASSLAQTTSLSEINTAVQATARNYGTLWKIASGELSIDDATFEAVTISDGSAGGYRAFVAKTSNITAEQILAAANLKDENGDGSLVDEILASDNEHLKDISEEDALGVDAYVQIFDADAEDYNNLAEKNEIDKNIAKSESNAAISELLNGPGRAKDGGGKGGGSNSQNDYEQESDRIKKKIDEIDSAIKDLADNDIVDMSKVNELIEQKIALQKEYKKSLEDELMMLDQALPQLWSEVVKAGNNKYIEYDKDAKMYTYTDAYYDEFYENGVPLDNEQMSTIEDQLNGLNKIGSEQLAKQVAIKELIDNLVRNQGEDYNAERTLKGRERRQTVADAEEGLIGRLPEEIQGPLMMMNTAEDAMLEYQEIQANKVLAENMQQELDVTYAGIPDAVKEYMTFDEYSGYGIDLNKIYSNIEGQEAQDDMINRVMQNAEILNTKYDALYDVLEQLDGGKIQDAIYGIAKASKTASKALKNQDKATDHLNDAFNELEKKLGLSEDALDGFASKIGSAIENSEILDKEVKGLGIKDVGEKINNSAIAGLLSDGQKEALTQVLGDGGTVGDVLGSALGGGSDMLNSLGDVFNFDMMNIGMDMFDTAKGMIDQGKQMIEKIIGYITQATQVIVDAWTNREDYLYNFLKVIEKHLQEYEKLQRYSTQLEKGRLSSSQDILNNWNEQWKSLQLQLEEQTERLETRQEELNRSRWNPFSLISGWDPTTDTLYENRSVKFAWDLLIGFSSMLPMGLGAFGQQLNQLYEDYDQRVQNSYEDRLAAEQALLDIEDERLELVKVGSEEATEFEQKLLDAMIQKEQEQIDELTRLNDAITDANSKLISTLQDNLDKMRQDRENEKKEEELGEKERRLAYLRQDTSGANMMEIKKLEEELEEGHEDYTDTLIDQKISELEKQNELAAEQRQQQIDLLQGQLDYAEKYGLYWDAIYGMLYTIDENGNAVLNPENFDLDGNIRENSQLAQMLGTFSDRLGMSVWSSVLDNEEVKRLGRYYGAFIGMNGVDGDWANYWALKDPGANDPNYAQPEVEIPDGIWGVLYKLEMLLRERSINNNPDLINRAGRAKQWFRNGIGNLFGIEDWAEYKYEYTSPAHVQPTIAMDMKETSDSIKSWFANGLSGIIKDSKGSVSVGGTQNNGDQNITNYFNIGTVGENISLDDMVDKVSTAIRGLFTSDGVGGLQKKR